jgi:hypothetical protein
LKKHLGADFEKEASEFKESASSLSTHSEVQAHGDTV